MLLFVRLISLYLFCSPSMCLDNVVFCRFIHGILHLKVLEELCLHGFFAWEIPDLSLLSGHPTLKKLSVCMIVRDDACVEQLLQLPQLYKLETKHLPGFRYCEIWGNLSDSEDGEEGYPRNIIVRPFSHPCQLMRLSCKELSV